MPDTVAILNTICATFADSDPAKFYIGAWFDKDDQCGCIIGQSLKAQPRLGGALGIRLRPSRNHELYDLVSTTGRHVWIGRDDTRAGKVVLSEVIGITDAEAHYLFDPGTYDLNLRRGLYGHREALRRLDEVISRYAAKAVPPVEPVAV